MDISKKKCYTRCSTFSIPNPFTSLGLLQMKTLNSLTLQLHLIELTWIVVEPNTAIKEKNVVTLFVYVTLFGHS